MDIGALADGYFARKDIREQAIKDLAEIVAINSVASSPEGKYPYGKACARALDKAAELAAEYGFRTVNHDYHCMSVLYGESEREIGIVCHLDVVPAGDGWSGDPFVLRRENGLLIGRGSHDDKGPFVQALYTLRFLKECGVKLPFTVRLILGSDEEVGSSDLEYFRSVCEPPEFSFTPDSEFPVCIGEKSIAGVTVDFGKLPEGIESVNGGTVSNAVPGYACATVRGAIDFAGNENVTVREENGVTVFKATGKAAHAASPESGVNAISLLLGALIEAGAVTGEDKERFEFLRDATGEYLGRTLGIAAENDDFGYLTCVGGVITTENGRLKQNFNIRFLPETPYGELIGAIKKSVDGFGTVVAEHHSDGYFVSADSDNIRALTKACEDVLGEKCEPYTMGGGTYARCLPNTVAFGSGIFRHRRYLGDERGNAHQRDEYIAEEEFFDGMRIYSRALGNL